MMSSKQKQPNASIVSANIERSVFGVFSMNYKRYKKQVENKKDSIEIWKSFFIESQILKEVQRCLLYFNLPFD